MERTWNPRPLNNANNAGRNAGAAAGFEKPPAPEEFVVQSQVPGEGVDCPKAVRPNPLRAVLSRDPYNTPFVTDCDPEPGQSHSTFPAGMTGGVIHNAKHQEIGSAWRHVTGTARGLGDYLQATADDLTRARPTAKQSRMLRGNYGPSGTRSDRLFNHTADKQDDKVYVGMFVDPQAGTVEKVYEPRAISPKGDYYLPSWEHRRELDRLSGGWRPWADPRPRIRADVMDPEFLGPESVSSHGDLTGWVRRREKEWAAMSYRDSHNMETDYADPGYIHEHGMTEVLGPLPRLAPMPNMMRFRNREAAALRGLAFQDSDHEVGRMARGARTVRHADAQVSRRHLVEPDSGMTAKVDNTRAPLRQDARVISRAVVPDLDLPDIRSRVEKLVQNRRDGALGRMLLDLIDEDMAHARIRGEAREPGRQDARVAAVQQLLFQLEDMPDPRHAVVTDRLRRDRLATSLGRLVVELSESERPNNLYLESERRESRNGRATVESVMRTIVEFDEQLAGEVVSRAEAMLREPLNGRAKAEVNRRSNNLYDRTWHGEQAPEDSLFPKGLETRNTRVRSDVAHSGVGYAMNAAVAESTNTAAHFGEETDRAGPTRGRVTVATRKDFHETVPETSRSRFGRPAARTPVEIGGED
jgi:hypothetical protein